MAANTPSEDVLRCCAVVKWDKAVMRAVHDGGSSTMVKLPRCTKRAGFIVGSKPYCTIHAQMAALYVAIVEGLATDIRG